jgi:hypothetical protein
MPTGKPISRYCLVVLQDGRFVIDWENSLFQDIQTGEFLRCSEQEVSHQMQDDELETLRRMGCISEFDGVHAYFYPLPEPNRPTLD